MNVAAVHVVPEPGVVPCWVVYPRKQFVIDVTVRIQPIPAAPATQASVGVAPFALPHAPAPVMQFQVFVCACAGIGLRQQRQAKTAEQAQSWSRLSI